MYKLCTLQAQFLSSLVVRMAGSQVSPAVNPRCSTWSVVRFLHVGKVPDHGAPENPAGPGSIPGWGSYHIGRHRQLFLCYRRSRRYCVTHRLCQKCIQPDRCDGVHWLVYAQPSTLSGCSSPNLHLPIVWRTGTATTLQAVANRHRSGAHEVHATIPRMFAIDTLAAPRTRGGRRPPLARHRREEAVLVRCVPKSLLWCAECGSVLTGDADRVQRELPHF